MAKVSLRIYNREIESLIDQGHISEAIAHCHHILRTFSKHLATYRLLGKAHLELKGYAEAVDVFGRVLMAVPDDFVSHVGMSIICDEQNKLDDAIWHMQRAFESQPSNAAIQGELQRLYGRRDGMEPPKIRMTRGALAHMYVQGELYPQAVAEIRAVLLEDPDRADMQVLLARAYFRGGQKADASDMCAQLLKRYQYSFDANRIMVDLLPATAGVAESTQVYRMRVGEMDPYATFAKGSVFQSDEVADAAISLERLEYTGGEETEGQAWTSSLGLGSGVSAAPALAATTSPSSEPDWLTGGFSDTSSSSAKPASEGESSNEIPDFLREAGWGESNSPEQPVSFFDEEPVSGGLTPAEIPDWLKGQVPVNAAPTPAPQIEPAQSIEIPDWLLDNQTQDSAQASNVPDWLRDTSAQTPASESAQADNTPDWLSGMENKQTAEPIQESNTSDWLSGSDNAQAAQPAQEENVADWLSKLDETPAVELAQEGNVPDWLSGLDDKQTAEPLQADNTPDWLSGLDDKQTAEPLQEGNVPDWLSGLGDKQIAEPAQEENVSDWLSKLDDTQTTEPLQEGNVPDWLSGLEQPSLNASSVENLGSTAQEQDDAVAWLESLAAKHGAKPEEMVTDPNKRSETPPEWVSQAQNLNQETPAASAESLGSTAQEQDDAVAWLESLAAKHGAKPEEMVTDPNKRSETPPEWVSQAQSIGEAQSTATKEVDKPEQKTEAVEHALNIGEQFFAEFESASTAEPLVDETSAWLQGLEEEEKQGQPASTAQDIPDWLRENQSEPEKLDRAEIPEWLSDTQSQTQDSVEQFDFVKQEASTQQPDLPNWLDDIEKDVAPQNAAANQDMPENDLANWLNSLDDEPGLPFDAVPTPDSILFSSQAAKSDKKLKEKQPVAEKSDMPDWLSDGNSSSAESQPEDEWKEPAVSKAENLPDWLQEVSEEESETVYDDDDDAPWLHRERWEAEEPQQPKPTSPSDWHPLESKPAKSQPVVAPKQEVPVETQKPFVPPPPLPSAQPATVQTPQPAAPPAQKKKIGLPARKQQPEGANAIVALNQAKSELDRGDIPAALSHYGKLIKKGKHLEETIRDLTESIYRYPVEVGIWQTLGDAYMRANRLKEALEAYNKAEELIR